MEFQAQKSDKSRPTTALSEFASSQHRPYTASSGSPFFEPRPATRADPFARPTLEAGSLSTNRPSGPTRPMTQHSSMYEPHSASQMAMPPPRLFTRDEATTPRAIEPSRPTTAQIFRHHTTSALNSQYDFPDPLEYQSDAAREPRASASNMADLQSMRQAVDEYESPAPTTSIDAQHPQDVQSPTSHAAQSTYFTNPEFEPSATAEPRPATAVIPSSFVDAASSTSSHEARPYTSVPLKRSSVAAATVDRTGSRPTSSSLTLPELPRPKSVRSGLPPTRSNATSFKYNVPASRPMTASASRSQMEASSDSSPPAAYLSREHQESQLGTSPTRTSLPDSTYAAQYKDVSAGSLDTRKNAMLKGSTNSRVSRLDSLADAPHEVVSPPVSPPKHVTNTAASKSTLSGIAPNARALQAAQEERMDLDEYASQSPADRQAAMDEFIVANLENPAFTKLCEDVENCWRRIALGL